jgi:predicted alpha/beta-hydrolase family hydrolase
MTKQRSEALRVHVSDTSGDVSGLLLAPPQPRAFYVFGHGAGAGMQHSFMNSLSERLAERGVATLRYQFPYAERGQNRPDPQPVLLATVRAAVAHAVTLAGGLPVFAGGKSMGGRMTSLADAETPLGVRGIVFFGFPLHPPGRPGVERAAHLREVHAPLLFLQGTRDELADLTLLRPIIEALGERATLHVIDTADHSFRVLKRAGKTDDEVQDELAEQAALFMFRQAP